MTNIDESPKTLEELLPADMFIGTSLILREGKSDKSNRFLYGMRPIKEEGPRQVVEVTGIGGGLEATDSSPGAGAIREAQEEIACAVTLVPSAMTLLITGYDNVSLIQVAGPEKPLAIIYRHYKSPPHSPWHPYNKGFACLVLFLGKLKGRPRPERELPNLIWLPSGLVLETARRDVPLGELLMAGAALVPGRSGAPLLDSLARMTDSQEALALALGNDTPAFYDALFRGDFPEQLVTKKPDAGPESEYSQDAETAVAYPAEHAGVAIEKTEPNEQESGLDDGEVDESKALEEQISALRATLDLLRREIGETTTKLDKLVERTARMESELGLLRKTSASSRNKLSELWRRRHRRDDA